jgi:hypothetical protein
MLQQLVQADTAARYNDTVALGLTACLRCAACAPGGLGRGGAAGKVGASRGEEEAGLAESPGSCNCNTLGGAGCEHRKGAEEGLSQRLGPCLSAFSSDCFS